MRTAEERLTLLHERVETLQSNREQALCTICGSASGGLALCLLLLAGVFGKGQHMIADGEIAGSLLLFESAGGYVLVAVAAFAAGVAITLLAKWHRNRRRSSLDEMDGTE